MKIRTRDEGRKHTRELLVDHKVLSRLLVIDYQMRIGSAQVKMGGIGDVATKIEHRMKGYARKLMEDSVEYMKNKGYDVSVLFGIPDFYHKFGYSHCLPEYKLIIRTKNAEASKSLAGKYKVRQIQKKDFDALLQLYNKDNQERTCSLVRIKKHFRRFRRGSNWGKQTDSFLIKNAQGLLAYAVFDKSDREVNIVEVASRSDRLFPTLLYEFTKMAIQRRCGEINLFMPPDHPFAQFVRRYGCQLTIQYSKSGGGMMRVINQPSLFEKIQGELDKRLQRSNINKVSLRVKTERGETKLVLGKQLARAQTHFLKLSQDKLIQLLVGHRNIRDVLNDARVKASKDIEPVANILFSGSLPYTWLPDHF